MRRQIVDLDISIHKGLTGKPVVIFIHGLAIDKHIWISPLEIRIFAKSIPLRYLAATRPGASVASKGRTITAGDIPETVDSLWSALGDEGYNLVCWSQRRPVGPVSAAVEDLKEVMAKIEELFPDMPVALIGHSRGGLVARKFMETPDRRVRALITIASPHAGSSLSRIGVYLSPLHGAIRNLLPKETHGTVSRIFKRISELVDGDALKELLPGSDFFRQLKDAPSKKVHYLSFGGEKTELITLYKREKKDGEKSVKEILTIPDSLLKFIPASKIPDEITPGKGDIMVSAESSVLPHASEHYNLQANHFTIMWDRKMIRKIRDLLDRV